MIPATLVVPEPLTLPALLAYFSARPLSTTEWATLSDAHKIAEHCHAGRYAPQSQVPLFNFVCAAARMNFEVIGFMQPSITSAILLHAFDESQLLLSANDVAEGFPPDVSRALQLNLTLDKFVIAEIIQEKDWRAAAAVGCTRLALFQIWGNQRGEVETQLAAETRTKLLPVLREMAQICERSEGICFANLANGLREQTTRYLSQCG